MSTWREQQRADRIADREQARLDAAARSERRVAERVALAEQQRKDAAAQAELDAAAKAARQAKRAARWAALAGWLAAHRVDGPIYLLGVAAAVLAVPAMARHGVETYGSALGVVLPVISELGMWAFAVAVQVARRTPGRPVWSLQVGIWVFAGYGFALNLLDGLRHGWSSGLLMGLVSIAGVIAHQLAVASPRRTAVEKAAAKLERQALAKTMKIRAAAIRHAVGEIDHTGTATLVFAPGRYEISRRGRLTEVPVSLADEVAAWLAQQDRPSITPTADTAGSGAVAVLDPEVDQQESTPRRRTIRAPKTRTPAELEDQFWSLVKAGDVNPTSAESIRKALKCKPESARKLRDKFKGDAK
ncbi:hypothetical protein LCL61_06965 [Amycolatopsis coloradensis]|uniref:Uncharacterized protein n=1 Tax=Amycolatopsis coloradensis TaxID=76021 RepID=A0ACD5B7R7_9PSEU